MNNDHTIEQTVPDDRVYEWVYVERGNWKGRVKRFFPRSQRVASTDTSHTTSHSRNRTTSANPSGIVTSLYSQAPAAMSQFQPNSTAPPAEPTVASGVENPQSTDGKPAAELHGSSMTAEQLAADDGDLSPFNFRRQQVPMSSERVNPPLGGNIGPVAPGPPAFTFSGPEPTSLFQNSQNVTRPSFDFQQSPAARPPSSVFQGHAPLPEDAPKTRASRGNLRQAQDGVDRNKDSRGQRSGGRFQRTSFVLNSQSGVSPANNTGSLISPSVSQGSMDARHHAPQNPHVYDASNEYLQGGSQEYHFPRGVSSSTFAPTTQFAGNTQSGERFHNQQVGQNSGNLFPSPITHHPLGPMANTSYPVSINQVQGGVLGLQFGGGAPSSGSLAPTSRFVSNTQTPVNMFNPQAGQISNTYFQGNPTPQLHTGQSNQATGGNRQHVHGGVQQFQFPSVQSSAIFAPTSPFASNTQTSVNMYNTPVSPPSNRYFQGPPTPLPHSPLYTIASGGNGQHVQGGTQQFQFHGAPSSGNLAQTPQFAVNPQTHMNFSNLQIGQTAPSFNPSPMFPQQIPGQPGAPQWAPPAPPQSVNPGPGFAPPTARPIAKPRARTTKAKEKPKPQPKIFMSRAEQRDAPIQNLFLKDLPQMMYAHGDVLPQFQHPESVQVLNDIVSDFIIHMTRGAELHQVAARRKNIKVEDFRWALRHDLPKLGRVDELLAAEQKLKAARNIFTDELEFAKDAEKGERSAEARAAKAAEKNAAGTSKKGKNKGNQAKGKTQAAKGKAKDAKTKAAAKKKGLSKKQRGKLAVKITDKAARKVRFADSAEASVHHEATSSGTTDRASDAVKALELEFDFAKALDDALATMGDDDDSDSDSDFSVLEAMNEYGDMIVEECANEDPESEEDTDSSEEDSDASDEDSDASDEDDDSSEEESDSSDEEQEGAANAHAVMAEANMSDEDDEDISEEE